MSIIPFNSNKFPSSDAVDIIMESELIDIIVGTALRLRSTSGNYRESALRYSLFPNKSNSWENMFCY